MVGVNRLIQDSDIALEMGHICPKNLPATVGNCQKRMVESSGGIF
jgi:hypothetical protein